MRSICSDSDRLVWSVDVQRELFDDGAILSALHMLNSDTWAARYNTGLLIKLTPKGVVFSFSFLFLDTPG